MSSEQVDAPKAAEGAPAQSLPSRPAKQPKEKKAGGGKASLEVCWTRRLPVLQKTIRADIDVCYCSFRFSQNSSNTVSPFSTRSRPSATPRLLVRFRTGFAVMYIWRRC